jgi:ribosomal peptide maturation radical SAM protein 1
LDVLLVSMPFGSAFAPSLGLSLLKAGLTRVGLSSRVRYFSIQFAETVGRAFYQGIAQDGRPRTRELAGEWIFSRGLFDWSEQDEQNYLNQILFDRGAWTLHSEVTPISPALARRILGARAQVEPFLNACLQEVLRDQPKIVGFTSIFQQHVASLALARRIKSACPGVFIVLGGANCEGVMGAETVRQFPFVDAVVSGEGDQVFPALVQRVLGGRSVVGLQGVRTRESVPVEFDQARFPTAPPIRTLDELPYPDFEDYFEQFQVSKYGREWQPNLFFETSRGCWWGEKMHCTFCGLNGATMSYRSKSPGRALDELTALAKQYPGCDIQVVDNILDMSYFKTFVPELAGRRLDLTLFYETKSNLKKDHIRLLRAAGIRSIQPGIESFSDAVLALMRKGVSGLQNIQLLKWCKELGVEPSWNLLFGFPGEPPEEYVRMAKFVPLLTHLRPPDSMCMVRLDRFSPNFFDAGKLGLVDVEPVASYRHVYQLPEPAIANLAYYFTFQYREPRDVASYTRSLEKATLVWRRAGPQSELFAVDVDERLLIWDLRPISRQPLLVLSGLDRVLYQACDAACDVRQLVKVAADQGLGSADIAEVSDRLEPLVAQGVLLHEGSRYLALAISLGEYSPDPSIVRRFYRTASSLGRRHDDRLLVPLNGNHAAPAVRARRQGSDTRKTASRGRRRLTREHFTITESGDLEIRMLYRSAYGKEGCEKGVQEKVEESHRREAEDRVI